MNTIAVINNKGGVGKTSTTFHVGIRLAQLNYKVLVIDADAQCNLTQRMNVDLNNTSIVDLVNSSYIDLAEYKTNLMVLRGSLDIEKINLKKLHFSNIIKHFSNHFDYCLIDCPPRLFGVQSQITMNEIIVKNSNSFLIPIHSDQSSLLGLDRVVNSIRKINKEKITLNVFFSKAETNTILYKKIRQKLNDINSTILMNSIIRKNEDIVKAEMMNKSIFEYNQKANGSYDYIQLTDELIKRIG